MPRRSNAKPNSFRGRIAHRDQLNGVLFCIGRSYVRARSAFPEHSLLFEKFAHYREFFQKAKAVWRLL